MIALDNFEALRRKVAALQQRRERAAGAAEQIRERLRREYGVADADAARAKLERLAAREIAAAEKYQSVRKDFEAKYSEQLGAL